MCLPLGEMYIGSLHAVSTHPHRIGAAFLEIEAVEAPVVILVNKIPVKIGAVHAHLRLSLCHFKVGGADGVLPARVLAAVGLARIRGSPSAILRPLMQSLVSAQLRRRN